MIGGHGILVILELNSFFDIQRDFNITCIKIFGKDHSKLTEYLMMFLIFFYFEGKDKVDPRWAELVATYMEICQLQKQLTVLSRIDLSFLTSFPRSLQIHL